MKNELGELSEEEIKTILKLREEKHNKRLAKIFQKHIAKVFLEWIYWSENEKITLSYSTFVNDFRYSERNWALPEDIFFENRLVKDILGQMISFVDNASTNIISNNY